MTLTAADVAEIMRLVEQSAFDHLSLEMNGMKLALSRAGAAPAAGVASLDMASDAGAPAATQSKASGGAGPQQAGGAGRAAGTASHDAPSAAAASASAETESTASGAAGAVQRGGPGSARDGGAGSAHGVAAGPAQAGGAGAAGPLQGIAAPADPYAREITAPMLGTFFRAPKPGAAPFVEVGSAVAEDTVIAIIEVMKLMNTVRAGIKGVITEILPADESLVEFGAVLMRARADA